MLIKGVFNKGFFVNSINLVIRAILVLFILIGLQAEPVLSKKVLEIPMNKVSVVEEVSTVISSRVQQALKERKVFSYLSSYKGVYRFTVFIAEDGTLSVQDFGNLPVKLYSFITLLVTDSRVSSRYSVCYLVNGSTTDFSVTDSSVTDFDVRAMTLNVPVTVRFF